ncbi:hypothetical protein HDR58_04225 [bacterium]|nr:hypothetical protein [bacterium]
MNVRSIVGGLFVAGAICSGYYTGMKTGSDENKALQNENIELKSKMNGLEKDLFDYKKQYTETVLPLQMDSLKRTPIGSRTPEFLDRVINNASFLDSINNTDKCLSKVVKHMSNDEVVNAAFNSHKNAKNLMGILSKSLKL